MRLSEDQVGQYRENGFLIVDNLLEKEEIEVLSNRAEAVATGSTYPHLQN